MAVVGYPLDFVPCRGEIWQDPMYIAPTSSEPRFCLMPARGVVWLCTSSARNKLSVVELGLRAIYRCREVGEYSLFSVLGLNKFWSNFSIYCFHSLSLHLLDNPLEIHPVNQNLLFQIAAIQISQFPFPKSTFSLLISMAPMAEKKPAEEKKAVKAPAERKPTSPLLPEIRKRRRGRRRAWWRTRSASSLFWNRSTPI